MIRRETIIGPCRLLFGDCMEILPTLGKFDAVVTDPPYGLGMRTVSGGTAKNTQTRFIDDMKYSRWDDVAPSKYVFDCLRGMSICQIIWGGNYFELPPTRCILVWDKMTYIPTMSRVEIAWTSLDSPARYIQINSNNPERQHPTQKPVSLMRWCIRQLPSDVETILDPFAGSGTTGVASIMEGKSCTLIEREEKYYDIAVRRCKEAWGEGSLFDERTLKASTPELFAGAA